jgi:lipoate---protein ligase
MWFLDLTLSTPAENLALDEALLLAAERGEGGEILRFWEWPRPAIVLGTGCRLAEDVIVEACQADDVPIVRRSSGGGTVLLGAGCLCFSLVLAYDRAPELREVRPSYGYILGQIRESLLDVVENVKVAGTSDLAIAGNKFSGNSQQRKRSHLLHHGTMLYAFDIEQLGRYIRMPSRQPEYRLGRDHSAFLMNLPIDVRELKACLRSVWNANKVAPSLPTSTVTELATEKYSSPKWTNKR